MNYQQEKEQIISILSKAQVNDIVAAKIAGSVAFVDKYLAKVEELIDNKDEQDIAYQELLITTYSAIEALCLAVVDGIICKCKLANCKQRKKCKYYKDATKIRYVIDAVDYLNNVRMVYIFPSMKYSIDVLRNKRNYVHMINYKNDKSKICFDKDSVERLVDCFYEVLNQLDLTDWYNENDYACIKELDENDYRLTKSMNIKEAVLDLENQLYNTINSLFLGKDITNDEEKKLRTLLKYNSYYLSGFIRTITRSIYYNRRYFNSKEEFLEAIQSFKNQIGGLCNNKSGFIDKLKSAIENDERIQNLN